MDEQAIENQNTDESKNEVDAREMHQKRADHFLRDLSNKCDEAGVKTAYAVVIDPECAEPLIFMKGHTYNVAKVMVDITRLMRDKINDELTI